MKKYILPACELDLLEQYMLSWIDDLWAQHDRMRLMWETGVFIYPVGNQLPEFEHWKSAQSRTSFSTAVE